MQSEIEANTIVRAQRAALEKLINGLHSETGNHSTNLFFPWKLTPQMFRDKAAGSCQYGWFDDLPDQARVIMCQALDPASPMADLGRLYRDAAHHGRVEYLETVETWTVRRRNGHLASESGPHGGRGVVGGALPPWFRGIPIDVEQSVVDGVSTVHGCTATSDSASPDAQYCNP